jgi:hypothetical protein
MKLKHNGVSVIVFLAGIAGMIISATLLKEDVLSTAYTLFNFFPERYGVVPSSTWNGAIYLGVFVSVTQIVAGGVMLKKELPLAVRIVGLVLLVLSVPFDAWTDIVFRSKNLTGDMQVAMVTTIAFYTFGSEIMQTLSWIIIFTTWRQAVREMMWISARGAAGFRSIRTEWPTIVRSASTQEQKKIQDAFRQNESVADRPIERPRPASSPLSQLPHARQSGRTYSNLPRPAKPATPTYRTIRLGEYQDQE